MISYFFKIKGQVYDIMKLMISYEIVVLRLFIISNLIMNYELNIYKICNFV